MTTKNDLCRDIVCTGTVILREYGSRLTEPGHRKEKVSLVLLSRSVRQLQAIAGLVECTFVSDAWVLYRCLLERYLLFTHLCKTGEFEVYDDWCFKRRYEGLNRIKSIHGFKGKRGMRNRRFSEEEKGRYSRVQDDERVKRWRRPDMETVARDEGMKFLYDAGYDWASGHVHASSQEGEADYRLLIGHKCDESSLNAAVVLDNAALVTVLHLQEFANEPEHNWRKVVYDLLKAFAMRAGGEGSDYSEALTKVVSLHKLGEGLCLPATG